jgi:DUF1009 family protein
MISEDVMEKIGLLAGLGKLPVEFSRAAKNMGFEVFAIALVDGVDADLQANTTDLQKINIARLDTILEHLKSNNVAKVTMIGKITKEILFSGEHEMPDAHMLRVLASLPDRSDDTMMMAFVKELALAGIQVFDQTALLKTLMPSAGVLTKRAPTDEEIKDMEFGFKIAKEIGGLDIGQTVVVKHLAVMAVEAIEGTDACVRRGGQLARGNAVVAKVAKPKQDNRFDMPAVGVQTIESMIEAGAKALVMEAGKTLLVEKEKVIALADANDIAIMAM